MHLHPLGSTLALGLPGGWEWIVLLVLGLLIFGRRLPEVGRSIGKSIVEFKRGIKGIEDEIESESSRSTPRLDDKASERPQIPEEKVGGEGENPYAAVKDRSEHD